VLFHVARVYREFGDLRRAMKAIDAAHGVAEANSDRGLTARCLYLMGELALRRRAFKEAQDRLLQASSELDAAEDRMLQVYTLIALALLRAARHNPDRDPVLASETAERAVRLAQDLTLARQEAYAYAVLAFTYLARDKAEFALAVSRKGMRFLEQQPVGRKREAEIRFMHARGQRKLGRDDEAAAEFDRARVLVLARAAEIANPAFRRAFLRLDLFNVAVLRASDAELPTTS
jgi:tetratricopeptide (TPR) repeat protein